MATTTIDKPNLSIDQFSTDRRMLTGWLLAFILVFGFGGWAIVADLSGAVIAPGSVVVDRNSKKVQHKDGGIVAAINVRAGDKVDAGQVLMRLDETQTRAELGIIRSQLIELTGRKLRLSAERDGMTSLRFPESFEKLGPEAAEVKEGELRLFSENIKARQGQREQLEARIGQLQEEISGLSSQRDAKKSEYAIIRKELETLLDLHKKNLIPNTRVFAMEREATRLNGEHGALIANIARAQGQIGEVKIQLLGLDQSARTDAQKDLRSIEARMAELAERQTAAQDRLARMELRAPQSGIVHELNVHTVGGVVSPAEQIMLIVPEHEQLVVEARFAPNDRDQLSLSNAARLRFTAFNQRTTPEVKAFLQNISADVTHDPKTGQSYYTGRITLDDEARKTLGNLRLIPGMPVEVYVATEQRTALTYFTKPFTDQWERAFKER